MCHPGLPLGSFRVPASGARRRVEVVRQQESPIGVVGGANEGGGGGRMVRQCVCSPTSHPGSFRCRQHHGEYKWVGRI
ncbi:hypothetical protein AAG906_023777 [Vitis piasezkii]